MSKSLLNICISTSLVLSIFLPTILQPIKIGVLILCFVFAGFLIGSKYYYISKRSITQTLIYTSIGLIWSTYGFFAGNPGAISVLTVMVIYPLTLPFLAYAYHEDDKEKLKDLFFYCGIFLTIFDLLYISLSIFHPGNILSEQIFTLYADKAVIDNSDSYFKFTIPNISSMVFLFPFMIVTFFHSKKYKILSLLTIILMSIVIVLSGRRALFIAPILGVLATYILTNKDRKFQKQKSKRYRNIFMLGGIVAIFIFLSSNFYGIDAYVNRIQSITDFTNDNSNIERKLQMQALLDGVSHSPLIGAGAGASASYTRSTEQPWAYELAYVAFLFQYGIFGFGIYSAGILYIIYILVKSVNRYGRGTFEFAFLAGFITFMIANATNPYLNKFDYMWIIFIPYALMNRFLMGKQVTKPNEY